MGNRIFSTGTLYATLPNPAYVAGGAAASFAITGITGTNASYNGSYANSGQAHNGKPVYTSGANYLYLGTASVWLLSPSATFDDTQALYHGGNGYSPDSTGGTWSVVGSGTGTGTTQTGTYQTLQSQTVSEPGGGDGDGSAPGAPIVTSSSAGNPDSPTIEVPFALLQSITLEMMGNVKELFAPVSESTYAVDRVYYNCHVTGKAKVATVSAIALRQLTGGTNSGGSGSPSVTSIGKNSVPMPAFHGVFETVDTSGVLIVVDCPFIRCPGVSLEFKIDDFTMPDFSFDCLADPTSASQVIATVTIGTP